VAQNKVKVLRASPAEIETAVNNWLADEGAEVDIRSIESRPYTATRASDNQTSHYVLVTIWYTA
jgi:hypothetical protein